MSSQKDKKEFMRNYVEKENQRRREDSPLRVSGINSNSNSKNI